VRRDKVPPLIATKHGAFDGKGWERLCQQAFKKRYMTDGYTTIPASPGDFGLEGFTLKTGYGFQCYCPEKYYTRDELYDAQRDKITTDLAKLKKNEADLKRLLGDTRISHWVFVTPEIDKHALVAHARKKEAEVKGWGLSIIDPNFCILLHDGDYYLTEINDILASAGLALNLGPTAHSLPALTESAEVYEDNIKRKCGIRLSAKQSHPNFGAMVERLGQSTLESFLEADGFFREIEASAPATYFRLLKLIAEYERHVVDAAISWVGTPNELTTQLTDGLTQRIESNLAPAFDSTNASMVSRHMVARWLAVCELDYYV
jgi:hypothetical protein